MAAQPSTNFRVIETTGPVTVERTGGVPPSAISMQKLILILGPTGAGKSTFIEALANDSTLRISSNRLDGFTQSVTAYRLNNATHIRNQIYLIDVPGFADTKISAMGIVSMLKAWMEKNDVKHCDRVLYFTPINVVRLPGSQREVLRTFRALTGIKTARMITIVSTMWDSIWSDSARDRAERNFTQLQEEIWKDEHERGSTIVRFMNTQESALSILQTALHASSANYMNMESLIRESKPIQQTPFASHLYQDLQTRISGLKLQQSNIQLEIQEASVIADEELTTILGLRLVEIDTLLAKFEQELCEFGPPPPSLAPDAVASKDEPVPSPLAVDTSSSISPNTSSLPPIAREPVQYQIESATTAFETPPSMTMSSTSSVVPPADHPIPAAVPKKQGVLTRALHGLKHLGKKVD